MWHIVEQTEKEQPVKIKQVRFAPVENKKTGEVSFMPLRMTIFKVIVSNGNGEHNITWNAQSNAFIWKQPDRMEHPLLKDGHKTMRNNFGREHRDTLAPKVRMAGEKERFDTTEVFAKHLIRVVGPSLATEILDLFIGAISMSVAA